MAITMNTAVTMTNVENSGRIGDRAQQANPAATIRVMIDTMALTSAGMSTTRIVDEVELARHHPLIPGPLVVSDRNGGCLIGTLGRAA